MPRRNYKTITCADCGGPAKAPNPQTKYCTGCRLARGAAWHDGRESTCSDCGKGFIDWNRNARKCGRCFIAATPAGGRESVRGTCGVCRSADVPLVCDRFHICYVCLHHPARFKVVKGAILEKQRQIRRPS